MMEGPKNSRRGDKGFVLVVTLSLLVLLTVIGIGMLSLSAMTMRSGAQTIALREARSNARLALVLALGELQEKAGRDRAITGPAGILDDGSSQARNYTGVWEARGNPRDGSSDDALGAAPDYNSSKHFVSWLVSNTERSATEREGFFQGNGLKDPVEMVGPGSVGANAEGLVAAGRVGLSDSAGRSSGGYAWWVSENATKALVRIEDEPARTELSRAESLLRAGTPGPYGLETVTEIGLSANSVQSDKAVTLGEAELLPGVDGGTVDAADLRAHYHDLTTDSNSLLTNVTAGGLRKDLSLFFEGDPERGNWTGSIKEGNPPLGPYQQTALSPRSEYDTGNWKVLRQHYALHKTSRREATGLLTGSSGETLKAVDDVSPPGGFSDPYPSWNYQRKLLTPVVARLSYVLSVGVQDASKGSVSEDRLNAVLPRTRRYDKARNKYIMTFHAYPVVALWNPYSLSLDCPGFSVGNMGMSVEQTISVGGNSLDYQWIDHNYKNNSAQWNVIGMTVDRGFTMAPGEVKMFFATSEVHRRQSQFYARGRVARNLTDIAFDASPGARDFSAGIVKNGVTGETFNAGDANFPGHELLYGLFVNPRDIVQLSTKIFTPQGSRNSGPRSDYNGLLYYGTYSSLDVRMVMRSFGSDWRTEALWWTRWGGGNLRQKASKWSNKIGWRNDEDNPVVLTRPIESMVNVVDLVNGREQPFMVVDLRMKATESDPDQRNPNINWLHNIPTHPYSGCTGQGTPGVQVGRAGNVRTAAHARPYTVVYAPVQSASEAWNLLQIEPFNNELRSFMGSSYWPGGQHKAVAAEVPLVPLQSIAQFQHVPQVPTDATRWSGLSLQNYAIGNSYPNPNLASDEIRSEGWKVWLDTRLDNADHRTNMDPDLDGRKWHTTVNGGGPPREHFKPTQHLDRSYAANTLLWDDFYFSGLAEYRGDLFGRLDGDRRSLRGVVDDFLTGTENVPNARIRRRLSGEDPATIADELVGDGGYRKAAAYMELAGGFNVNSVSKVAWKAFLASNLRKEQVLLSDRGRPETGTAESTVDEYIISRCSLANGVGHDSSSTSSEKWLGYRTIDGDDLDDLATRMVEQVRERGPFRSVGEFVNRRLEAGGGDASLSGALQAALDLSSVNAQLAQDRITRSEIGGTDYAFEEAATLSRHAGTPAYVMQGDLLQSIGSLVQVRSDTFTIRGYGESSDSSIKAWCEATVQRDINWVDRTDEPDEEIGSLAPVNEAFGRRFRVLSFRWLSPSEV